MVHDISGKPSGAEAFSSGSGRGPRTTLTLCLRFTQEWDGQGGVGDISSGPGKDTRLLYDPAGCCLEYENAFFFVSKTLHEKTSYHILIELDLN